MAFSLVKNLISLGGEWNTQGLQSPYFYPEDVAIIMSQSYVDPQGAKHSVVAVQVVAAKVKSLENGGSVDALVLLGLWHNSTLKKYCRMDAPDNLVGFFCGPHNNQGGVFDPDPVLKLVNPNVIQVMDGPDKQ